MDRFDAKNAYTWYYGDHFLVECPICQACAQVLTNIQSKKPVVRIACDKCGHSEEWVRTDYDVQHCSDSDTFENGHIWVGAAVDWYFHHPLWLQTSCCGSKLWAYNAAHLSWIKSFILTKLKENAPDNSHGWSNQSLASRLPKWLEKIHDRDAVMSALEKLERKLD